MLVRAAGKPLSVPPINPSLTSTSGAANEKVPAAWERPCVARARSRGRFLDESGEWTQEKMARLRALVEQAHRNGLWIRFYTLDGATKEELSCHGWFHDYNFGSVDAALVRWRAAIAAHVDYVASDQYELLGAETRGARGSGSAQGR